MAQSKIKPKPSSSLTSHQVNSSVKAKFYKGVFWIVVGSSF